MAWPILEPKQSKDRARTHNHRAILCSDISLVNILVSHQPSLLVLSVIWNALREVAVFGAWKWKRHPRSCLLGSLQILQLLWRKLHSHREHVKLEENYDKRSPKGPLKLGSYFFPQAESQFPKSKNETKYIFIKYCFDITPLCMTGQALPLSL